MLSASQLFKNRRVSFYLVLGALNLFIFMTTNPLTSPIMLVVIGFMLGAVNLMALTFLVLVGLEAIIQRHLGKRRLLIALGSFETVMLALSSIGQLTWWDWLVVVAVWALGYWYGNQFYRRSASRTA